MLCCPHGPLFRSSRPLRPLFTLPVPRAPRSRAISTERGPPKPKPTTTRTLGNLATAILSAAVFRVRNRPPERRYYMLGAFPVDYRKMRVLNVVGTTVFVACMVYFAAKLERTPVRRVRFVETSRGEEEAAAAQGLKEARHFYGNHFLPTSDPRTQFVLSVANKLLDAARPDSTVHWNWEVTVIDVPTNQSIVYLGSGKLLVFSGILEWVGHREDPVAALLAHEIAHSLSRHFAETKWRRHRHTMGPKLYRFNLDPTITPAGVMDEGDNFVFDAPYWREQEEEADRIALHILRLAGYPTSSYGDVLERLLEVPLGGDAHCVTSLVGYVRQHPLDEMRMASVGRLE